MKNKKNDNKLKKNDFELEKIFLIEKLDIFFEI